MSSVAAEPVCTTLRSPQSSSFLPPPTLVILRVIAQIHSSCHEAASNPTLKSLPYSCEVTVASSSGRGELKGLEFWSDFPTLTVQKTHAVDRRGL